MKKLLIFLSLLLFLTLTNVNAASVYDDFEFDVYDNKTYDLETGAWEDNINYSSTNRVVIPMNSEDNTLYFNNADFHHILFYDAFNKYLGYANTGYSTLELSLHIGYDVYEAEPVYSIEAPENATKFALVVYNYNDTRLLTAYTYPSIDTVAWEELTYRDIFEDLDNLIINGDFEDTTPTVVNTRNVFDYEQAILDNSSPVLVTQTTYDSRDVLYYIHDATANGIKFMEGDFDVFTQYTIHIESYSLGNSANLIIYYTDASTDTIILSADAWYTTEITTDVGKTIDYISPYYFANPSSVYLDIDTMQIEVGTTATDFIEYEVTVDYPDNWLFSSSAPYIADVVSGELNLSSSISTLVYQAVPVTTGHTMYYKGEHFLNNSMNNIRVYNGVTYNVMTDNIIVGEQNFSYIWLMEGDYSNITFYYSQNTGTFIDVTLDNLVLYDFTEIGFSTMPTATEFEEMQEYYELYKDVSGIELSYNDIFGSYTQFGGDNNLILHGDFSLDSNSDGLADSWDIYANINTSLINNEQYIQLTLDNQNLILTQDIILPLEHIVYVNSLVSSDTLDYSYYYIGGTNVDLSRTTLYHSDNSFTHIIQETTNRIYLGNLNANILDILIFKEIVLYDLTSIFAANHEPEIDTFDGYYAVYVDPLQSDYDSYLHAINLISLEIQYSYDDTPTAPLDTQTGIEDSLDTLGVGDSDTKVFLALGIMVIAAVVIGLKTKSTMLIIMTEVILTLIFTMLGWFSFWILLLMALGFTLLILRKGIKGGHEQ